MIKGLEHLACDERGLFRVGKRKLRETLSTCLNIWRRVIKKREPDSSQGYLVTGQETMTTNRNTGNCL